MEIEIEKFSSAVLQVSLLRRDWCTVRGMIEDGTLDLKKEGYNLLQTALKNRQGEIASILINKGCIFPSDHKKKAHPVLHLAIAARDKTNAKLLLDKGACYVNAKNIKGETPLHIATLARDATIVQFLLEEGARVDSKNREGETPLHFAVRFKETVIVKLLLDRNANVYLKTRSGETPLVTSIRCLPISGTTDIVEMLLLAGADVNDCNGSGESPLHIACKCNNGALVKLLLQGGASVGAVDREGSSVLHRAVLYGHFDNVMEILNFCPTLHNIGDEHILRAAVLGDREDSRGRSDRSRVINELFNHGLTITADNVDDKVFLVSIQCGHLKILEEFLKLGASANCFPKDREKSPPLCVAAASRQAKVVDLLIRNGADINSRNSAGKSALEIAVRQCDIEITTLLLKHNVDLSGGVSKELLMIPLQAIWDRDCEEIFKVLLQHPECQNSVKKSNDILNVAIRKGNSKIIELLLQSANINLSEKCVPPLLVAVESSRFDACKSRVDICEMLLKNGADVNMFFPNAGLGCFADKFSDIPVISEIAPAVPNYTALLFAVEMNSERLVELLIHYGANIDCKNGKGDTPLAIACRMSLGGVVKSLLDGWASMNNVELSDFPLCQMEILMTVVRHISRRCALKGLPRVGFNSLLKPEIVSEMDLYTDCSKAELELLKTEKVGNSKISFFEVLTKSVDQIAIFLKNEGIVEALSSHDWKKKFPVYAGLIKCNFEKAKVRFVFLQKGALFFEINMPFLPHMCTDQILYYLTNSDLAALNKAAASCSQT